MTRTVEYDETGEISRQIDPVEATPKTIYVRDLKRLGLQYGGMTGQMLKDSRSDPSLLVFWELLESAPGTVDKDDADLQAGLDGMEQAGYLPNGKQSVLDNWPTE